MRCSLSDKAWKLTKPVANEIVFSGIYKQLDSILEKSRNSNFKVPHPVYKHSLIHCRAARHKLYVPNTNSFPDRFIIEEFLHVREVIAEAPNTLLSNVIVLQGDHMNVNNMCQNLLEIYFSLSILHNWQAMQLLNLWMNFIFFWSIFYIYKTKQPRSRPIFRIYEWSNE